MKRKLVTRRSYLWVLLSLSFHNFPLPLSQFKVLCSISLQLSRCFPPSSPPYGSVALFPPFLCPPFVIMRFVQNIALMYGAFYPDTLAELSIESSTDERLSQWFLSLCTIQFPMRLTIERTVQHSWCSKISKYKTSNN